MKYLDSAGGTPPFALDARWPGASKPEARTTTNLNPKFYEGPLLEPAFHHLIPTLDMV